MAVALRGLYRFNVGLLNNACLKNICLNTKFRLLYTEKALGIVDYEKARLSYRNQFINIENTFRTKMNEVCEQPSGMIFTEDLKAMLHLLQKRDEDMNLIEKMVQKFNNQGEDFRFGSFIFGPVVMRAFYYLSEPNIALKLFRMPELNKFFSQHASYQLLMTLLFKSGRYSDIKEVYDIIRTKYVEPNIYSRHAVILAIAAAYKENTPESYEYALTILKEILAAGGLPPRRAISLLATLAIKQGAPHVALEILSNIKNIRTIDVRCIKLLAYTHLEKFVEIIPVLRRTFEYLTPDGRKEVYFYDVIEELSNKLKDHDTETELIQLVSQLKNNDLVISDTLDFFLCRPVDRRNNLQTNNNMNRQNPKSFNQTARRAEFI